MILTKHIEAHFLLEKFFEKFSFLLHFWVYFLGTHNTLRPLATIAGDSE